MRLRLRFRSGAPCSLRALPPRCDDAPFESGSLLRQESGLISWYNEALSDQYAGNGQLFDRCRK